VLERRARVNLLAVTGGDLRLSGAVSLRGRRAGTGGAGRKVDVQVRLVGAGRRAEAHVTPVGPVSLVEERRGVFIPGVGFRAHVNHPGTRGRRPVSRAMQTHSDEAGREGLAVFAAAVERHMRGA
jgi:hypothetical protein